MNTQMFARFGGIHPVLPRCESRFTVKRYHLSGDVFRDDGSEWRRSLDYIGGVDADDHSVGMIIRLHATAIAQAA